MNTLLIALLAVVGLVILIALAKRRANGVDFAGFASAVVEAADAGEKSYRAQVNLIASDHGRRIEPSVRGLALARLLCASFPTAAYAVVEAGNAIIPSVKRDAPVSGKGVFGLASGAAVKPLSISPDHPAFAGVKEDTNEAVNQYIRFFNDHFQANPVAALAAAEEYLAPQWHKALELSLGPIDRNQHSTQFCTSGLHLFVTWLQALSK